MEFKKENIKDYKKRVNYMKQQLKILLGTYIDCYPINNNDNDYTNEWDLQDHYDRIDQMITYFDNNIVDTGTWD